MNFSHLFYASFAWIRFLVCLLFLLLSITTTDTLLTLLLISVAALLIRGLDGVWQNLIHMLRLLRWFVLPILLLHLLFSHGELIFPGSGLPFTWQGIGQGLWLSIHLVCIFIVAMLMFRALNISEWNRLLLSLPLVGKYLPVYLMMLTPMRQQIHIVLNQLKQQWMLRRDWSKLPLLLLTSFRLALSCSRDQAACLWLRWPQTRYELAMYNKHSVSAPHRLAMNAIFLMVAIIACGIVLL
ncbi:hypothetical protein MMIC_P1674 [Mariprofundus micogutta]|uniref:Cobalt/nickel transport system permease protein n=1 Tax=Mariprofundus micogutta TaxID=1921010 RepID=A0A1L8CP49_9PROT|nr:hypothetical protein [Mariprofundus micogutta]GAV20701.1 hypothetical protein MMIC_P1674 [Mariprofundus micogutta]